ncbi:DNA cytosine methyltransferase [Ornithinimicrobium sediminis]|uniref:DNA cytosine methyltransferase n=1 Tax=Ornithinimicrobium sediminis TaxID=2904603 RepID=UPI001E468171|nr:DNA (cytosine-5-)-methyltransferase [Ornithinimicrobium sediminis]
MDSARPRAAEFFAGIGLVRLGMEAAGIDVVFANDIEPDKYQMYVQHFGPEAAEHFILGDIGQVFGADMPELDIAWASFPCTDLSLAGNRKGLVGGASSTFWDFTRILHEMGDGRPPVVALENVVGFATSHGGADLIAAIRELNSLGYSVDVLTLDARRFVAQSRPRLFLVGALEPPEDMLDPSNELRPDWLQTPYGDPTLRMHRAELPSPPTPKTAGFGEVVQTRGVEWWDPERTTRFLDSLSPYQADRLEALRQGRVPSWRTAYRRTRNGVAVWEIRPDDIAGCLRTARGGSSKQAVVKAGRGAVQVRWMTPLEYARLMGAGEYDLAGLRANQVYFGFGDAVCVPAVQWLAEHYLLPLVKGQLHPGEQPVAGREIRAV